MSNTVEKNLIGKSFIRTYQIHYIAKSNDYDYLYITIRAFQDEEIETVKVKRKMFIDAKEEDIYEITFKITNNNIKDTIKSIWDNTDITDAQKTNKVRMELIWQTIPN